MLRTLNSRAFRMGFARGFTSPYDFILGRRDLIDIPKHDVSIRAWAQVGRHLDLATREEATRSVETPSETSRRREREEKLSA